MVPNPGDPQQLNRYSYGLNNPVRYTDPTGHYVFEYGAGVWASFYDPVTPGGPDNESFTIHDDPTAAYWSNSGSSMAIGSGTNVFIPPQDGLPAYRTTAEAASRPRNRDEARYVDLFLGFVGYGPALAAAQMGDWRPGSVNAPGLPAEFNLHTAAREGGCSFSAYTWVATEEGLRRMGTLKVGELVLGYDERLGTTGMYTVTAVLVHVDTTLILLTINGERIETTPGHPFFSLEGGWLRAGDLWIGAHVRSANGDYGVVQGIEVVQRQQPMYNLTVATAHTYFVGEGQWLVHNICWAHKAVVYGIKRDIVNRGLRPKTEFRIDTPRGSKSFRAVDVAALDSQGNVVELHQVGLVNSNGMPVEREMLAFHDIRQYSKQYRDVPFYYWPYNTWDDLFPW